MRRKHAPISHISRLVLDRPVKYHKMLAEFPELTIYRQKFSEVVVFSIQASIARVTQSQYDQKSKN